MDKLELKHITPYFPYELDVIYEGEKWLMHALFNTSIGLINESNDDPMDAAVQAMYESVKPILRNLSDLTKEIEHNGEKFVPKDKLEGTLPKDIQYMYWMQMQKLFEWHFDVFNLLSKNLAIDINTLITKNK